MKRSLPLALFVGLFAADAAAFENPRQAQGYLRSTWSTVHGDSSNSDHVPLAMTSKVRRRWHLLMGAGIWTPPVVGTDGTVYAVTGQGPGHSHLHAISPDGEILWRSAPQKSADDFDSLAVFSAPVLDGESDIYIGDGNQFWAFHPDGKVKWVTELQKLGVESGFVTGIIVGEHVGGVSLDGKVMLLQRSSGERLCCTAAQQVVFLRGDSISLCTIAVRHPECGHCIEDLGTDFRLRSLTRQEAAPKTRTQDPLEA